MAEPEFCRHPGDPQRCAASLIEAVMTGTLEKHCVLAGLASRHPQCRPILTDGLRGKTSSPSLRAAWQPSGVSQASGLPPLVQACQGAIHLGYQRNLPAAKDIFVEAFQRLVWSRLKGLSEADGDDLFQDIFLAMDQRLRNPKPIRFRFAAYLGTVIVSAYAKLTRQKRRQKQMVPLPEQDAAAELEDPRLAWESLMETGVVECWEDFDLAMKRLPKGTFVERVLLAQGWICCWDLGDRLATKETLRLWGQLARCDEDAAASVAEEARVRLAQSPGTSVTWIAADMLRAGRVEPWQLPLVLAQEAGMTVREVLTLFRDLSDRTVNFVDQRARRIVRLLAEHVRRGEQAGARE